MLIKYIVLKCYIYALYACYFEKLVSQIFGLK